MTAVKSPSWPEPTAALLTGGGDKPYALGISAALAGEKLFFDFIGSDDLAVPEVLENPFARFLNLRGDQNPRASSVRKLTRLCLYYVRLLAYAVSSKAPIFHILWHNKVQWLDRTLLLLFCLLCGVARLNGGRPVRERRFRNGACCGGDSSAAHVKLCLRPCGCLHHAPQSSVDAGLSAGDGASWGWLPVA